MLAPLTCVYVVVVVVVVVADVVKFLEVVCLCHSGCCPIVVGAAMVWF